VCKVPVKVYPYSILPTSASAGLIEGLPEALSMDAVKKRCSGCRV
jgi:phosphatidylinositol kinase/protein kinase (PI-3  family)